MTETFRAVEPCYHNVTKLASNTADDGTMDVMGKLLTVAEARALHRWLTAALPCEHKRQKAVWKRGFHEHNAAPDGYRCLDCEATMP